MILVNNQLNLHIYVDRIGLEIFNKSGTFFMAINIKTEEEGVKISAGEVDIKVVRMEVSNLKSA